jgi:hypothetical protein
LLRARISAVAYLPTLFDPLERANLSFD